MSASWVRACLAHPQAFDTRAAAVADIKRRRAAGGLRGQPMPWKCKHCRKWHIGRDPRYRGGGRRG